MHIYSLAYQHFHWVYFNIKMTLYYTMRLLTHAFIILVGKLSEAFGRKPVLIATSLLFLVGSVGCGISQSMFQMIFARAVAGFGGSGLVLLPSIVIHDTVPLEQSSQYQSYINVSQTVSIRRVAI